MTAEALAGLIDRRLIAALGVRPANSPGWGQLEALKTVRLRSADGEVIEVKAGRTRVCRDHWAVRLHPEVFRACDQRDIRTQEDHARSLRNVRQELERGRPTRTATTRSGVLPPKAGGSALRLPSTTNRPVRALP